MSQHLILGAAFRALGALPSGWRQPRAHRDPAADARILRAAARTAEAAKLDYLYFGDWLSTGAELQYTEPDLLARIEPFGAIGYAAAVTKRIGLIATANSSYTDPYSLARVSASIERLSAGRVGLNLAVGADPRSEANFGSTPRLVGTERYDRAEEMLDVLPLLWDSWEDDAFVADAAAGVLIDPGRLHATRFYGEHLSVEGPLNAPRPVQGHLPIAHAGTSLRSRQLAASRADLAIAAFDDRAEAAGFRAELRAMTQAAGRPLGDLKLIVPVLPVVASTTEAAWELFDALVSGFPLEDTHGGAGHGASELPRGRNIRALSAVVGVPLGPQRLDSDLPSRVAQRFHDGGRRLIETVTAQTGRRVGGERPISYRHLLVAHLIPGLVIVGGPSAIADRLQSWFEEGAADGFNVLSAFLPEQLVDFAELVVPELRRRGLFRTEYTGTTLREHLGLARPANLHAAAPHGYDTQERRSA